MINYVLIVVNVAQMANVYARKITMHLIIACTKYAQETAALAMVNVYKGVVYVVQVSPALTVP